MERLKKKKRKENGFTLSTKQDVAKNRPLM